jgi:ParB family chromosome partitioning protein
MTSSTDAVTTSELRFVPLMAIQIEEGANPRRRFDEQALAELADSIRTHGLLQPLVVRGDGNGGYLLTAGERRYRACQLAEVEQVPVAIKLDGSALEQAVDENLHRVDLDPVEEAHAFQQILRTGKLTKKQLAERVSKSTQYVNERLRLLDLPEPVQQHIADGLLPTRIAPTLIRIAKVSEPVAVCLAKLVVDGHAEAGELEEQPERLVGCLGDYEWPDPQPIALHVGGYQRYPLDHLPLPAEGCEDLHERYAALGEDVGFSFDSEDADAARSYGCLLEFKGRYWGETQLICDPVFIADRVRLALDGYEKQLRRRQREEARRQEETRGDSERPEPVDLEKERRKLERQQRTEAKEQAVAANFELGRKLQLRYDTVKITAPLARLLALLVLDRDTDKLAGRGLRYVREDWQVTETVERRGKQVEKTRYPESWETSEQLYAWIGRARSAEQILGRLLQALIAARHADQDAVANSSRAFWELPGSSSYSDGPSSEIPELLDKLAKPALPRQCQQAAGEQAEAA